MGRIVSVNVAKPQVVRWKGRDVRTAFFKRPVAGLVRVGPTNIEGDEQADLRVHGGVNKAVYVYPSEHYGDWARRLGVLDLPWGSFGENLTVEGVLEPDVRAGDVFQAGSARLSVTKPREPCYKMNARFQRDDAVKLFADAERPGFYCRVVSPGELATGDPFERVEAARGTPTVTALFLQALRRS